MDKYLEGKDVFKPEDFLIIPPVETSVIDIKELIEEWEINADKFKVQSPGESICRNSPGVK